MTTTFFSIFIKTFFRRIFEIDYISFRLLFLFWNRPHTYTLIMAAAVISVPANEGNLNSTRYNFWIIITSRFSPSPRVWRSSAAIVSVRGALGDDTRDVMVACTCLCKSFITLGLTPEVWLLVSVLTYYYYHHWHVIVTQLDECHVIIMFKMFSNFKTVLHLI